MPATPVRRATALAILFAVSMFGGARLNGVSRPRDTAMWVWSSAALLDAATARETFLAFCADRGVRTVFMQITTGRPGGDANAPLVVTRAEAWHSLVAAAHAAGLTVEALDGDPIYASRALHHLPLQITDAVVAYNRQAPPESRFDGLHFDNEPYLLAAWRHRDSREQLLGDYLDLTAEMRRRVRSPMTLSVDIPFWWHHTDRRTGEAQAAVTWRGVRQSAAAHLLSIVDVLTIMDYRNRASGADGIVNLVRGLLQRADQVSRARVRIGVETSVLRTEDVWFMAGPPTANARETLDERWRAVGPSEAYALRVFDDGSRLYLGVPLEKTTDVPQPPSLLLLLAEKFGVPASTPDRDLQPRALKAFAADPEWRDPRPLAITDPATGQAFLGVVATHVPLPKITFASRPAAMDEELTLADRSLRAFRQYAGIAVHHYDAYRTLVAAVQSKSAREQPSAVIGASQ